MPLINGVEFEHAHLQRLPVLNDALALAVADPDGGYAMPTLSDTDLRIARAFASTDPQDYVLPPGEEEDVARRVLDMLGVDVSALVTARQLRDAVAREKLEARQALCVISTMCVMFKIKRHHPNVDWLTWLKHLDENNVDGIKRDMCNWYDAYFDGVNVHLKEPDATIIVRALMEQPPVIPEFNVRRDARLREVYERVSSRRQ